TTRVGTVYLRVLELDEPALGRAQAIGDARNALAIAFGPVVFDPNPVGINTIPVGGTGGDVFDAGNEPASVGSILLAPIKVTSHRCVGGAIDIARRARDSYSPVQRVSDSGMVDDDHSCRIWIPARHGTLHAIVV